MKKTAFVSRRAAAAILAGVMLAACLFLPGCLKPEPDNKTTAGTTEAITSAADVTTTQIPETTIVVTAATQTTVTEQTAEPTSAAAAVTESGYINFNNTHVYIRADHSKDSDTVGRVNSFDRITVTEVYTDPTAKTELQRWGKTTFNGVTGWVALYYLTPIEISDATNDAAALNALWTRLAGYWNSADQKEAAGFFYENGKPYFNYFLWYSEIDFAMEALAPFTGDVNGIVRLNTRVHIYDMEAPETVEDGFLYLDMSDVSNGVIRFNYGNEGGWLECYYAGANMTEATPPWD